MKQRLVSGAILGVCILVPLQLCWVANLPTKRRSLLREVAVLPCMPIQPYWATPLSKGSPALWIHVSLLPRVLVSAEAPTWSELPLLRRSSSSLQPCHVVPRCGHRSHSLEQLGTLQRTACPFLEGQVALHSNARQHWEVASTVKAASQSGQTWLQSTACPSENGQVALWSTLGRSEKQLPQKPLPRATWTLGVCSISTTLPQSSTQGICTPFLLLWYTTGQCTLSLIRSSHSLSQAQLTCTHSKCTLQKKHSREGVKCNSTYYIHVWK